MSWYHVQNGVGSDGCGVAAATVGVGEVDAIVGDALRGRPRWRLMLLFDNRFLLFGLVVTGDDGDDLCSPLPLSLMLSYT